MRSKLHRIWIVSLAAIGMVVVWWPFYDKQGIAHRTKHAEEVAAELQMLRQNLDQYRQRYGTYPSNDEGLQVLVDSEARLKLPVSAYMYENRNTTNYAAFKQSICPSRRVKSWVKVDEGIYIYSLDAYYMEEDNAMHVRLRNYARMIGASIVVLDIVLVILLRLGRLGGVVEGLIIGSIIGWFSNAGMTCYAVSVRVSRRDPRAVAKQIELIEQYHKNGVINDQTYQRLRAVCQ